jgi:hypothetical protein
LTSSRDDPVLAKWQYGLGRVVAWLADDGTDLAAAWPEWQRYDEFWAAVLRWALPDPENRPLQVAITRDGPESVVSVEVMGEAPKFDDSGQMTATITTPGGGVAADLPLARTGPGVYEMRVAAPTSGAYKIELRQTAAGQTTTELAGFAVPPSPELQPSPDGSILLRAIATRTGGRVLSLDDPNRALAGKVSGLPLRHYRPLWSVPLMLALGLLVVEIALRMRVLQTLGLTRLLGSRG